MSKVGPVGTQDSRSGHRVWTNGAAMSHSLLAGSNFANAFDRTLRTLREQGVIKQ